MPVAAAEAPTPDSPPESTGYSNLYILLLICGFILRFGFVLWKKTYVYIPGNAIPFGPEVCSIAAHIVRGQGFSSPFHQDTGPTAWVAPIYPYFVALVFRLFGIYSVASAIVLLGIQCLIAATTGITIHALGRRTLGWQTGFWAAWIWALSPIFFRWPVSWIWDFAASAFLLSVVFIVTLDVAERNTRKLWLWFGGLWALIALTNPALLSIMPVTFLYVAFVNHRSLRPWLASAALAAVLFAALVSPWLIRNERVFGRPVFFRSNFWFEFHLGNYHFSNGLGFSGKHPIANPAELKKYASMGEMGYLDYYEADSLRFVREYRSEFLELTLHRVLWFWDGTSLLYQAREWWKPWEFWPLSFTGWLGLLFVLTRRPRGWLLFAAALLIYPLPYYFVYPVSKYRHAIEPELLLLSVYLVFVLWNEILLHRKNKDELRPR
jgi:4-amino-4-deoxy-L-arabinose transferase-like glycosyltransferase